MVCLTAHGSEGTVLLDLCRCGHALEVNPMRATLSVTILAACFWLQRRSQRITRLLPNSTQASRSG